MRLIINTLLGFLFLVFYACNTKSSEPTGDNSPVVSVQVNTVSAENNIDFLTASGVIQAKKTANMSTRRMGYIEEVRVQVGQSVKKGDLLIRINNSDLSAKQAQINASIAEAEAAFNNAERDYQRFQNLFEANSATHKEMDDIQANYEMAKARLETAKQMKNEINAEFAYVHITAAFDGVITSRNAEVGDMANPGIPLLSMEGKGEYEVVASIPESEITKVKTGIEVKVVVKSLGAEISGKVSEVSSSAIQTGGQYAVKIALEKTDADILSGMYVSLRFPVENTDEVTAILIPKSALVHRDELIGIYTISHANTAILRWLRLGRSYGEKVEVLSGLKAGEKYILSAESKLTNGTRVIIKE